MTIYATKGLIRMLDDAFNATNAAGDGSGEAKAARPDADGSHQPPALPQPCSLPCPREAMDAADVG